MTKKNCLVWQYCSEAELYKKVSSWLETAEIKKNLSHTLLFLEGEMGAGKSAFVRAVLAHLCPSEKSKGSPTFSIVNQYVAPALGSFYHIDLYRIKSENELFETGIESILDTVPSLVCVEWASLFQDYFQGFEKKRTVIQVKIEYTDDPEKRTISIAEPQALGSRSRVQKFE